MFVSLALQYYWSIEPVQSEETTYRGHGLNVRGKSYNMAVDTKYM